MPELPEVETIITNLREGSPDIPSILERRINAVDVLWHKSIQGQPLEDFVANIQGRRIISALRRGKFLHFPLDQGHLIIHLRMSGDLIVKPENENPGFVVPDEKHNRIIFHLDNDWRLIFHDTRKFGRVWLTQDPLMVFGSLGFEPFDPHLTPDLFFEMLKDHKRMIKPLLMDQTFLAGLGNIYTDEALFQAKIHPQQLAHQIEPEGAKNLLSAIRSVLREGIRHNGASIDWVYQGGDFQNHLCVYQRTGNACPRCGTIIRRIIVGQRGTHFCPTCQPLR
jgi:formamidopyrimidine-DNA glycosylase